MTYTELVDMVVDGLITTEDMKAIMAKKDIANPKRTEAMTLLGLTPGYSKGDLRKAYTTLVKENNPYYGGDTKVVENISKAYKELSNDVTG